MDIAKEDEPDDRGSVDNWLIRFLREGSNPNKCSTDDNFEALNLSWEVEPPQITPRCAQCGGPLTSHTKLCNTKSAKDQREEYQCG